jgi:hypothetical protein
MLLQSLIPDVIVQVVATVSGVVISIGIPLIFSKLNKISKVHTTLFGLDGVDSMGGMVDEVQSNSEKIQENRDLITGLKDTVEEIKSIVEEE